MAKLRDFYWDKYEGVLHLLRTEFSGDQESGSIETNEHPIIKYGESGGSIHADRRHRADHDAVTPELFRELDEVFKREKAWLTAILFIETLANQVCDYHYREFHDNFQKKNKFPLTHHGVADGAWNWIAEPREVFEMAFGERTQRGRIGKIDKDTEKWLVKVLSGTVKDMRWIVFEALKRDEWKETGIDKEEFWAKCVEEFPDWLKEEAQKSVRRA